MRWAYYFLVIVAIFAACEHVSCHVKVAPSPASADADPYYELVEMNRTLSRVERALERNEQLLRDQLLIQRKQFELQENACHGRCIR